MRGVTTQANRIVERALHGHWSKMQTAQNGWFLLVSFWFKLPPNMCLIGVSSETPRVPRESHLFSQWLSMAIPPKDLRPSMRELSWATLGGCVVAHLSEQARLLGCVVSA